MDQTAKRRRPYHMYSTSGNNKKQRKYSLNVGVKGFLCSCNNREKECIRESYNILNKYADQLYESESSKAKESELQQADIDEDFKREIEALKHEDEKRFQVVDSGAKNFLFIQTTLDNPVELAHSIISDISSTKREQTRFLIRLIPIEITCKAYMDDVKKAFEVLVDKHFKDEAKSFSVVFNHRNNNSLSRDVVIQEVADMIIKLNKQHKVDLKNAEVSVVIEAIRGIALLAVVPDYFKYKKYNLHLVCEANKDVKNVEGADNKKEPHMEVENKEASNTKAESKEVDNLEIEKGEAKCAESEVDNEDNKCAETVEN